MHRRIIAGLWTFLMMAGALRAAAVDVNALPKPTGYVSDLAHAVDAEHKAELEALCTKIEQQLGVQFALVTVDSVGDRPIRDVALDISRKWGVGSKKDNQGLLLLLAVKDRQSDIETGRGIEPYITDGFAGTTLRAMRPDLRAGDYGAALLTAAESMAQQIAQGKGIAFSDANLTPRAPPQRVERPKIPFVLILLGIFFLIWLFGRGGGRRGGGYRGGGGFLTGMLLGNLLGGGRGDSGGWGSSGGFGGGDSGGGGGFGGFGGGDFGGGGASSNW